MKKNKTRMTAAAIVTNYVKNEKNNSDMIFAATHSNEEILNRLNTTTNGMSKDRVTHSRDKYGTNIITHNKQDSTLKKLFGAFVNPFTIILFVLATLSAFTDIIFVSPEERNYVTVMIITIMVMISGILRFVQETRSGNAAEKLSKMIHTTACIERIEDGKNEIEIDEIVKGDIVYLSAGDMIPADVRILECKDLFVSQSSLTGESEPVEKTSNIIYVDNSKIAITEMNNLAFMGSNVISGSAKAVVISVGDNTLLGTLAGELNTEPPKSSFEKGVNSVSWVLIRFMLVMVPVVLFINGFTKGNWMEATLFAISIAVGLTPEMLPMIVTTGLAKGSVTMSKKKVIVKNLNAIQNLGAIDILCTDKTGTLTQDKIVLEYHLDLNGNDNARVLRHAYLNSYFQTGLKNLIDLAIIEKQDEYGSSSIKEQYNKVDEIPFDFNRRRMSVVVADKTGKTQMVTKGAVEEMLKCCSWAEIDGEVCSLSEEKKNYILKKSDEFNAKGMRVIAVAHKTNPSPVGEFSVEDETDMVLIGFLALLDPPKTSTLSAIKQLSDNGVRVKILTGDNEKVACCICNRVGLEADEVLLGSQLDDLTDDELYERAEKTTVLAKLSPSQKSRVVRVLREHNHIVGYMGDGINDAAAMKEADVGISVDTAVDIAKESSDVILLEKDLNVVNDGIIEGRKTYANMIKYIKMTASSNFGNMFSVLTASAFLPFIPMASIQLILLNLIYDISCTAIPWDNVDKEYLKSPRKWNADGIGRFMIWIGPTSSVFDIITYILMYFVICPMITGGQLYSQLTDPSMKMLYVSLFQTGWFVESMWSQTLVIHMIRTPKIPFIQSRASLPVTLLTFAGITVLTIIPFTPIASMLGLTVLPAVYFLWLFGIIIGYMILATIAKKLYIRKYGELL